MDRFYFAQKAFIVDRGRLLLVRKAATDPSHPGKWEVPGGRMDFGEEVDDHIRREIKEEVGLEITPGPPFYLWQWILDRTDSDGQPYRMQVVAVARVCSVRSAELTEKYRVAEDHLGEMVWVDLDQISKYDFIPNMVPVVRAFLGSPVQQMVAPIREKNRPDRR